MLQCCVRLSSLSSSVALCIVAKRCVLEQKLLLTAVGIYAKSIGTKMDDLDLCKFMIVNHCGTFAIEYLGNR